MTPQQESRQVESVLECLGYTQSSLIANTLQGQIWRAKQGRDNSSNVVIKRTNKSLASNRSSVVNGVSYSTQENILTEQAILKYVTMNPKCPSSIVKFIDFYQTDNDYYLIMEDGGSSVFEFITRVHKFIASGSIQISDWHKMVKIIFKQMIKCIQYLHSMNISHFDISLENFVMNEIDIKIKNGHISFIYDEKRPITIKLCDFGLAQIFNYNNNINNDERNNQNQYQPFISSKYVGKHNYMSPEIVNRKITFDAKKNDIFSLGVCLFMMIVGGGPFNKADIKNDPCFKFIINGQIKDLLKAWKKDHYVNDELIELFQSIFQYESERATLNDIKNSPWLRQNDK